MVRIQLPLTAALSILSTFILLGAIMSKETSKFSFFIAITKPRRLHHSSKKHKGKLLKSQKLKRNKLTKNSIHPRLKES